MIDLATSLHDVVAREGSDLHLHAGNSPLARIDGHLRPLDPDAPKLIPEDTEQLLHEILPTSRITEFENENELDFAYAIPGFARFRVTPSASAGPSRS